MPQTTHQTDKAKNHSKDSAWEKMQSYYNTSRIIHTNMTCMLTD